MRNIITRPARNKKEGRRNSAHRVLFLIFLQLISYCALWSIGINTSIPNGCQRARRYFVKNGSSKEPLFHLNVLKMCIVSDYLLSQSEFLNIYFSLFLLSHFTKEIKQRSWLGFSYCSIFCSSVKNHCLSTSKASLMDSSRKGPEAD